jgi:hypothetical protein
MLLLLHLPNSHFLKMIYIYPIDRKMERLRTLLADRDFFKGGTFLEFEPLPFLLDPELLIKGIVAEK